MQNTNESSQRAALEQLPTPQLAQLMRHEIRKSEPDIGLIKQILSILDDRETQKDPAVTNSQAEEAWKCYQKRIAASQKKAKPAHCHKLVRWLSVAAVLVIILTVALPQRAEAERFWDFLISWKDNALEYRHAKDRFQTLESNFTTNYPAMQFVYDEASKLGIENPLIPMWFEEGYTPGKSEDISTPAATGIMIPLSQDTKKAVFNIDIYSTETFHAYCRNDFYEEVYEQDGVQFGLSNNNGKWVAVWSKDNIEYFLTIDCQEETLRKILKSIFVTEEFL